MRQLLDDDGENRAVRSFLLFYGGGNPTAAQMATHMRASGFDAVPEWVALAPGHLTKGGAQAWLRMLFDLEKPAPQPEAQALPDSRVIADAQQVAAVPVSGVIVSAAQAVVAVRKRHGWSPEADAAIHALEAALSSPAPAPLSAKLIDDAAEEWFAYGDCPGREASRKKAAKLSFKAGVKFAEEIRFIGLDGGCDGWRL